MKRPNMIIKDLGDASEVLDKLIECRKYITYLESQQKQVVSADDITKAARKYENYKGDETENEGSEKAGKFHGFKAGAKWMQQYAQAVNVVDKSFIERCFYAGVLLEQGKLGKSFDEWYKEFSTKQD